VHRLTVGEALRDRRVLVLSAVYFGVIGANVGLGFFVPQIVQGFGTTELQTSLLSAIPYGAALVAMIVWGRRSDRARERRFHAALPQLVAAAALAASALIAEPAIRMTAIAIAACGIFSSMPVFWTLPTKWLGGAAAAGGIAMINSIGNLAGFTGPFAMGWLRDVTGSYTAGLLVLSASVVVSAAMVLALRDRSARSVRVHPHLELPGEPLP
jgi:nitrate/nitrite transporter NarK